MPKRRHSDHNSSSFYGRGSSTSIHAVNDRGDHNVARHYDETDVVDRNSNGIKFARQIEAGEEWLRMEAEQKTREVVLHAATGLLVGDKIVEGLPQEMQSLVTTEAYKDAAEQLAETIRSGIEKVGIDHGIHVDRVSLQEFELAPSILDAAVSACVSAYKPLIAQREAAARKMHKQADAYGRKEMLKGETEVIGPDAVAKREVLGGVQPLAFGGHFAGISNVLGQFFEERFVDTPDAPIKKNITRKSSDGNAADRGSNCHDASIYDGEPLFEDDEDAAKRELDKAKGYYEANDKHRALATLEEIVRLYGETRAGEVAAQNIETIRRKLGRGGPD